MKLSELDELLSETLEDDQLSRGERKALRAVLADDQPKVEELRRYRKQAFSRARELMKDSHSRLVMDWLEEVVTLFDPNQEQGAKSEVLFSPGSRCRNRIIGLLVSARTSVEICVYTITDDFISDEIEAAHRRGVTVRILTDISKAQDPGSDVDRLERLGIEVVRDTPDKYMHNKFAIFDKAIALTGSYNWTRSAAEDNEENLVVTDDRRLVQGFVDEFEQLWEQYSR